MPSRSESAGIGTWFSARPGWLAVLVTGLLVPPLALLGCVFGMVLLLAALLGRATLTVGRRYSAATG